MQCGTSEEANGSRISYPTPGPSANSTPKKVVWDSTPDKEKRSRKSEVHILFAVTRQAQCANRLMQRLARHQLIGAHLPQACAEPMANGTLLSFIHLRQVGIQNRRGVSVRDARRVHLHRFLRHHAGLFGAFLDVWNHRDGISQPGAFLDVWNHRDGIRRVRLHLAIGRRHGVQHACDLLHLQACSQGCPVESLQVILECGLRALQNMTKTKKQTKRNISQTYASYIFLPSPCKQCPQRYESKLFLSPLVLKVSICSILIAVLSQWVPGVHYCI